MGSNPYTCKLYFKCIICMLETETIIDIGFRFSMLSYPIKNTIRHTKIINIDPKR